MGFGVVVVCLWFFFFLDNPNFQPRNNQFMVSGQAVLFLQDVCIQTCDLILSNRIGREMRYGESKKLVFRVFSSKTSWEIHRTSSTV